MLQKQKKERMGKRTFLHDTKLEKITGKNFSISSYDDVWGFEMETKAVEMAVANGGGDEGEEGRIVKKVSEGKVLMLQAHSEPSGAKK